jgi:hypothetical protein
MLFYDEFSFLNQKLESVFVFERLQLVINIMPKALQNIKIHISFSDVSPIIYLEFEIIFTN